MNPAIISNFPSASYFLTQAQVVSIGVDPGVLEVKKFLHILVRDLLSCCAESLDVVGGVECSVTLSQAEHGCHSGTVVL